MIVRRRTWAISIVGLALALGFTFTPTQGATYVTDPNQSWMTPDDSGLLGSENGLFTERSSQDRDYSALLNTRLLGQNQSDPTCTSLKDARCTTGSDFIYYAQLPACQSASSVDCISEVKAIDPSGTPHLGSVVRYFPDKAQNQFVGDPALKLPSGGAGILYSIPGAESPAGDLYYVSFIASGSLTRGSSAVLSSVHASLVPVQLHNDPRFDNWKYCLSDSKTCDTGWNKLDLGGGGFYYNESGSKGTNCAETSWAEKLCAEKEAFPAGFKYSIKVRLTSSPNGWLHGRMASPEITLNKAGDTTEVTVAAEPIGVPTVYKHYQWADMPAELRAHYDPSSGKYLNSDGEGFIRSAITQDPAQRAWTTAPSPYSRTAIDELNLWLPYVNNTATVVPQFWAFRSLTQNELQGANKCFTDPSALNGIVTTNSTAYSPGPPAFDKAAGNLNYKVAAPHYLPNGSDLFKGSYDLVMRSQVARCIYGFSNAPIKATISIINSSGSPEVASTVVGESNGWLHLSAKGFEFSSPTVSVNLQQDQPSPAPSPSASPSATSTPAASQATPAPSKTPAALNNQRMSTITCVKGKVKKSVTGTKPSCPAGYKKV